MSQLTQALLKSLLSYDPATGVFTWAAHRGGMSRIGDRAGTMDAHGYVIIRIFGRRFPAHRLAWLYVYGEWPDITDHINHTRDDNRICNLRSVTDAINHQNRRRMTNSASGFLGVTWHRRDRRWQSHIELNGKSKHLGSYVCLGHAVKARLQAEQVFHLHRPR
jgi:hypothetical protein